MLEKGVNILTNNWNTKPIEIPIDCQAPFMRLVQLPFMKDFQISNNKESEYVVYKLMRVLQDKYNVQCCVSYIQGKLYVRVSSFVYNTEKDYIALSNGVKHLSQII